MSILVCTRTEYLERLRDLLPYTEASRILSEVDGLLADRIEAELEVEGASPQEAERRALEAFGPPEVLARELVNAQVTVDLATRRSFARWLAVVFTGHLLLSIVMTAAGGTGPTIPGLLAPLPRGPLAALFSGVLSVFLVDVGVLFLLFVLVGRGRSPDALPRLRLSETYRPRDAVFGLVLIGLVALILHPFRSGIFAVRDGNVMVEVLSPNLVALLPWVDVVLGLFALRLIVNLHRGGPNPLGVVLDVLGSAGLAGFFLYAALRGEPVDVPDASLGPAAASVLEELMARVFLLVFGVAALLLAVRAVKRMLRLRQLLASS